MAGRASAETMLKASRSYAPYPLANRENLPWQAVNSTLLLSDGTAQWKGVRLMYLQLIQDPRSVCSFARDSKAPCLPPATVDTPLPLTKPGAVVKQLVQMLETSASSPREVFPEADWDSSAAQRVVQTQMAGLLLSIIVILSLADEHILKQQLNEAGAVQLLCKIAIGMAEAHQHPDITPSADQTWQDRRDVRFKLHELYKLIPVAIASICQATGNLDSFMLEVDHTFDSLSAVRQKQNKSLVAKLRDDLIVLQHMHISAAVGSGAAIGSVVQQPNLQQVAHSVTLSARNYLRDLQKAYKCVITGYDEDQAGNCLYWLQKAPCHDGPDKVSQRNVEDEKGTNNVGCENRTEARAKAAAQKKKRAGHGRRPAPDVILAGAIFGAGMLVGAAMRDCCRSSSYGKHAELLQQSSLSRIS